jgi:carboxyl-terminal processing protease
VPSGLIVSQTRRDQVVVERHEADASACKHPHLPLALLVNQDSASASEVLAGALQDHGRATVVGVRTHGKACVNTVYTWKEMPFRLKLTTGRYRTPNGRDIERRHKSRGAGEGEDDAGGIAPDVEIALTNDQERTLLRAQRLSEPPPAHRAAYAALAARLGAPVPQPPTPAIDPQLARAIPSLRAPQPPQPPASTTTTVDRGDKDK